MMQTDRAIETLYGLGHWLLEERRPADAIHVFRTMLMSAPDDERSWLGLGLCHEQKGDTAVARELYGLAIAAVPRSFRCPLARARLLRACDAADEADRSYEIAEERASAADEDEIAHAIACERRSS